MTIQGYFTVTNDVYDSDTRSFLLMPNNDVLPLDELHNAICVYKDGTKTILHVALSDRQLASMRSISEVASDIELVTSLNISNVWLGETRDSIFIRYPELNTVVSYIDSETGITYNRPLVLEHSWG